MPYTSNKKPSGLDSASSVAGTDVLVIEKSGSVQKATATQLVDHAFATKGTAITNPSGSEVLVARDGSTLKDIALSNIVPALNITDAKVANAAAIAGTKISPNFGSQTVQTTGQVSAGSLAVSGNTTMGGTLVVTGALTADGGINATITGTSSSANQLTTARNIAATDDIEWNVNFNGSADVTAAATIQNNVVNDAKLRSGTACSVIGRSANSTGNVADIAAASDDLVLQRSSGSLGFGQVSTGGIADDAITANKLRDDASTDANRAVTTNHIRNLAVTTAKIADSSITNAKVSSSSADRISGSKITPDFGLQDIKTSGDLEISSSTGPTITISSSFSASGSPPSLELAKSRGSVSAKTAVQNGDTIGEIKMEGYDGTNMIAGADITAVVDGTPGTNDMPCKLVFSTTEDGDNLPWERMVIDSKGRLIMDPVIATLNTTVGGSIITPGRLQANGVYANTTSSAANVNVTSGGLLVRSTSSARYKTDIETAQAQYSQAAVFNTRPVWFRSTSEDDRSDWSHWGFIAEEVAEIDPRLVAWGPDENGTLRPEGVQYDRFVPHLCAVVKDQRDKIAALEARIAALEAA